MWPNPQFPPDLVTFTGEILNGKLHFLCSVLLSLVINPIFFALVSFFSLCPENIRKPLLFWYLHGVWEATSSMKWVYTVSKNYKSLVLPDPIFFKCSNTCQCSCHVCLIFIHISQHFFRSFEIIMTLFIKFYEWPNFVNYNKATVEQ